MKRRIRKLETVTYQLSNLDMPPSHGAPVEVPDDLWIRYQEAMRLYVGVQRELEYILEGSKK